MKSLQWLIKCCSETKDKTSGSRSRDVNKQFFQSYLFHPIKHVVFILWVTHPVYSWFSVWDKRKRDGEIITLEPWFIRSSFFFLLVLVYFWWCGDLSLVSRLILYLYLVTQVKDMFTLSHECTLLNIERQKLWIMPNVNVQTKMEKKYVWTRYII